MFGNYQAIAYSGQCEPPSIMQGFTISINGCPYYILACIKCWTPEAPAVFNIQFVEQLDINCQTGLDFDHLMTQIYRKFGSVAASWCTTIPPCPDNTYEYTMSVSLCWVHAIDNNGNRYYWPCSPQSTCDEIWTICWDGSKSEFIQTFKKFIVREHLLEQE